MKGLNFKREVIKFSKYFGVGLLALALSTFFSWLFIDNWGMKAFWASTIIGVTIFLIKYFGYRKVNLIKGEFTKFLVISVLSLLGYIGLSSLMIDVYGMETVIVIPVLTAALFIGRYVAFYVAGIIEK